MAGRPDCMIVTVAAGLPPIEVPLTTYDRACGFRTADAALTQRRHEDRQAARVVAGTVVHLSHVDSQYGTPLVPAYVTVSLLEVLDTSGATMAIGPLGLEHPDHLQVSRSMLAVAQERPDLEVWLYEELPGRVLWPEGVGPALNRAWSHGFTPTLGFIGTGDLSIKLRAIRAYRSQLTALTRQTAGTGLNPVLVPERFWRLARA